MRDALIEGVVIVVFIICVTLFVTPAESKPKGAFNEAYWVSIIAKDLNGKTGKGTTTEDGAEVDILTEDEAIEVDWAPKWAEGVGQALYYGSATRKKPVVIYLLSNTAERRFLLRGKAAAKAGGVRVMVYDTMKRQWAER